MNANSESRDDQATTGATGVPDTPGAAVKFAVVQSRYPGTVAEALDHAEAEVRRAAVLGARIICLQELFAGPYFCQIEDDARFALAESIPGPSTERFAAVAKELGVVIVLPLFEKVAEGVYFNSAAILDADGTLLGRYRKMHIPDDPQFYEKYYFSPGDGGFRAWRTRWGTIGVLICWDQWYPEAARLTAMAGAEVIFYPTAIGCIPQDRAELAGIQHEAWQTLQRSHAVANGCYVAAANRIGLEAEENGDSIAFWGQSFIVDPRGHIVGQASEDEEEILVAEIDRGLIARQRVHWPFFRDRRVDAYSGLTRRFGGTGEVFGEGGRP